MPTLCPGFFPLANVKYTLSDPVAQEFVNWRKDSKASFRCSYQILSRNANPNNENDLWNACAQVLNGTEDTQAGRRRGAKEPGLLVQTAAGHLQPLEARIIELRKRSANVETPVLDGFTFWFSWRRRY